MEEHYHNYPKTSTPSEDKTAPITKQEPDIEKRKIEIKEKLGVYSSTVLSSNATPVIPENTMDRIQKENEEKRLSFLNEERTPVIEQKEDGWISVKERLPDSGTRVIIEGGMGFHQSGLWYTIVDEGNKNPLPIKWEVKVWMPLPKPPKS